MARLKAGLLDGRSSAAGLATLGRSVAKALGFVVYERWLGLELEGFGNHRRPQSLAELLGVDETNELVGRITRYRSQRGSVIIDDQSVPHPVFFIQPLGELETMPVRGAGINVTIQTESIPHKAVRESLRMMGGSALYVYFEARTPSLILAGFRAALSGLMHEFESVIDDQDGDSMSHAVYHVLVQRKGDKKPVASNDLSEEELRVRVLEPIRTGRAFVVGGVPCLPSNLDSYQQFRIVLGRTKAEHASENNARFDRAAEQGIFVIPPNPAIHVFEADGMEDVTHIAFDAGSGGDVTIRGGDGGPGVRSGDVLIVGGDGGGGGRGGGVIIRGGDGGTARASPPSTGISTFQFDVALSFAGENRPYVEKVAAHLKATGVKVFYDDYETAELWGKDLYVHLSEVYSKKARFCVVFISEHYAKKAWTNHERKAAQARAFQEQREYILPARFDDTEISGINETVGYVDLRTLTPENLVSLIRQKLGG